MANRKKVSDARIAKLFKSGRTVAQIARTVSRTWMAVELRLRKLNLK
jgi:hypothetical protein